MEEKSRPQVGIGVLICKEGQVFLGKRKGSYGAREYSGAGGHLEYMESFEECAKREAREETGLEIENVRFLCLVNVKEYVRRHYVDIGLVADWESGEPQIMESEK